MTKARVLAVLAGSLVAICLLAASAQAQQPGGGAPAPAPRFGAEIALVDIQYIFKNFRVVKQIQNDLQAQQEKAQAVLKNDADAIKKLQDKLADYRPGTKEYEDLDKQIVNAQADLSVRRTMIVKDLHREETKQFARVFQQIQDEIDAFASANGVVAVLQFSRETIDPEKEQTLQAALGNPVLWHHKNLDISPYILQNLERRSVPETGRVNPGFPSGARGGVQR